MHSFSAGVLCLPEIPGVSTSIFWTTEWPRTNARNHSAAYNHRRQLAQQLGKTANRVDMTLKTECFCQGFTARPFTNTQTYTSVFTQENAWVYVCWIMVLQYILAKPLGRPTRIDPFRFFCYSKSLGQLRRMVVCCAVASKLLRASGIFRKQKLIN